MAILASADTAAGTAVEAQRILTVDASYLESTMPLYASIEAQAALLKNSANLTQQHDIELAQQQRVSDVLIALPEVIAELAQARHADLVLDRAVIRRVGIKAEADITTEVESQLQKRFGPLPLEPM